MIRLRDLEAAEAALDRAMEELRSYSRNPAAWSAHERLDDDDRRVLVLHERHFEQTEYLTREVEIAEARLRAVQREMAGGA